MFATVSVYQIQNLIHNAQARVEVEENDDFPDRRGFFTGHRIPLELFGADTLRRIELTSDETTITTQKPGQFLFLEVKIPAKRKSKHKADASPYSTPID